VSIGEALAEARQQAGLTVDQVSEQTRIRVPIIRSIEAGDYAACGGDFYARGDIRSIALAVGADPEPLIREYDMDLRDTGPISAASINELLARSRPEQRRGPDWRLVLALALVVAVGFGAYYFLSGTRTGGSGAPVAASSHAGHGRSAARPGAGSVNGHGSRPAKSQALSPAPGRSAAPAAARPRPRTAPPRAAAPAPAAGPAQTLVPVSAAAFGGGLSAGDNPQGARLVIAGHPGTAWHTDWYTSARFGNLYPGTGLLLDMGHPVTVTSVRVRLAPVPGASFQLRVGPAPVLSQLRPVASSSGPGGVVRLRLGRPAQGRYVAVWFTQLPPDRAGTFMVTVHRVVVNGRG
jgi:transcriptional regulator with XRE-family HTH domain